VRDVGSVSGRLHGLYAVSTYRHISSWLAAVKQHNEADAALTVVPDTHAVIKRSLRQHVFCIGKDLLGHLVAWDFHAVKVQLSVILLVDLFECLRMAPWDSGPTMIGKLGVGVTARHRIGDPR
jgi:hypothetical protein